MNSDAILNDLFRRTTRGIKPGLERMVHAAEKLGNPQNGYRVVHVAGTNGKGSTVTMISSILRAEGHRVGTFTSPHIVDFRERFIIDGTPVSDDEWIAVWNDIQELCDSLELTFFEISTLMAFELFKRAGCDYVVLETGLGGRLDATNICAPVITAITALSVEHTEYLGTTLEEIAGEKLGIVKENTPLVINGENKSAVLEQARQVCLSKGATLYRAVEEDIPFLKRDARGQYFSYTDRELFLPLQGDFQQQNCSVAVKVAEVLGCSHESIVAGIGAVFIPCRLQKVSIEGREFLFDVAHNPQATEILCNSLALDMNPHFLIGMMKDKEVGEMLESIVAIAASITVITPEIPRAMSAEMLGEIARELPGTVPVAVANSVAEGIELASQREGLTVVTGSFYTVSDVLKSLSLSPYEM